MQIGVMACLLKNDPVSCSRRLVKPYKGRSRSESKSEQGAIKSPGADPKPGELSMARVKSR